MRSTPASRPLQISPVSAALLSVGLLVSATTLPAASQSRDPWAGFPPEFEGAREEVYKVAGDSELKLWIFEPEGHQSSDRRPVVVFFFGGGWRSGHPGQFEEQCRFLAENGLVAITADYRVQLRQGVTANASVSDAKSAVRWIRKHADRLGIDPDRLAVGGGSAGGHLAAATALLPGHDDPQDDLTISTVPQALVLFNPATVLAPIDGQFERDPESTAALAERLGADPVSLSPAHHIQKGNIQVLMFHGTADEVVPFETANFFCREMAGKGNDCQLEAYEGEGHGFFNHSRNLAIYEDTMRKTAVFFRESLRWIP